ncbi:MAG: FKBP-type peptidyl-prolyl cis-trans isomerase [Phycisphaerales bacterium]
MRLMISVLAAGFVAANCIAADPKPVQAQPTGTPAQVAQQAKPEGDAMPPPPPKMAIPDGPALNHTELDGGLITEDIKIGDGYEVKPNGAVVAFYHGTLKDGGKEFDSAFRRGEPVAFPLNGVIEGWQKGVPGMRIGGIRRLTIPAKMGYGERGAGASIPPNSDLVFIIQLVDALQIIDEKEGTGEEAAGQCVAVTTHTITGADGKVVETATAANPYIWIPGELQAMQFGLEGMKVGGKRKLIVPAQMNKVNPQAGGTRTGDVPCTIEFELEALRNLGPKKAKTPSASDAK